MFGIIYCITNTTNGKKYIGQSINTLEYRWSHHKHDSQRYNHKFANALKKYGFDCWDKKVIEEVDINLLNEREIYWINHYSSIDNGYNIALGGYGIRGYTHSKETKNKMKENHKGMTGRKLSEETKRKISEAHKGMKATEETKEKLSQSHKGKQSHLGISHSEESKKKMSETRKRKLASGEIVTWNKGK